MKETRRIFYFLVCASSMMFASCGPNSGGEDGGDLAADMVAEDTAQEQGKVVYYATPSLVEVAGIMKSSGATFTNQVLNKPANAGNYSTQYAKAINVGVYGADLTYSAMFDQSQEAINYLKTIKAMCEELGMTGAFETELLSKIETNISNRDSLLDIITDFYWSADAYLMDNERTEVASMIVAGGWVESMYIACHMAQNSPKNKEIKKRIAEQKLVLKNLILFLKSSAGKDAGIADALKALEDLKLSYDNVKITAGETKNETNEAAGETVISNETEVTISDEQLATLCSKIGEIRMAFVK